MIAPRMLGWALLLATLADTGVAWASPPDVYGIGSRSSALSGAVAADVADASANYYNPAGLVRSEALRIMLGHMSAGARLRINGVDSKVDRATGFVFGLVVPGKIGPLPFAVGVATHLNDRRVSRTVSLPREQPRWVLYDNRPHRVFLGANVAIRPLPWLLLGGGIAFQSRAITDLSITGDIDILLPEDRTLLQHEIESDLLGLRYPQLGIQIDPEGPLSFGLVYRGQFSLKNELGARVDAHLTGIGDPIAGRFRLLSVAVNAFLPRQLSLGAAYEPTDTWRIGAEVTWVDWSSFIGPVGSTDITLEIDVPPALADVITVPEGLEGFVPLDADFHDRFVPRLGVEHRALRRTGVALFLQGGYRFERSPVPEQSQITTYADADRHVLSAGLGLRLDALEPVLPGWLRFDAHVSCSILPERNHQRESLVHGVGDFRSGGTIVSGGITAEVGFE